MLMLRVAKQAMENIAEDDEGHQSVRERRKDREIQNRHRYAGNRVIGTSGGAKDQEGGRPVVCAIFVFCSAHISAPVTCPPTIRNLVRPVSL